MIHLPGMLPSVVQVTAGGSIAEKSDARWWVIDGYRYAFEDGGQPWALWK